MFGASHRESVGTLLRQGLLSFDAPILDIAPEQIQGNSALISTKLAVGIAHKGSFVLMIQVYSSILFSPREKVNGFERNRTDRIQKGRQ
jgi:hypothetical protein